MKKIVLISFLVFTNLTFAQECFTFDTRFIDCLDKWVILPQDEFSDSDSFTFGYVFFDEDFNLTFQKEGTFEIEDSCLFSVTKSKKVIRTKIEPSKTLVAVVSQDKFSELQILETPKWVKKLKENAETYFYLGYLYNEWGENHRAFYALQKAQALNPKFAGLEKELAFTYNSLGMYDKAIEILQQLREKHPKDAYIYRELIFALTKSAKLKEAAYNLRYSISICKDKKYHGENCLYVLRLAFDENDQKTFSQFLRKAKVWNKGNAKALDLIKLMETEMKKKD